MILLFLITINVLYFFREIKIDCITINNTPIKNAIDDLITRLFDALLASLRRGVTKDMATIDDFLNGAMDVLGTRPQTIEEIGEANNKFKEFEAKKKEVGS